MLYTIIYRRKPIRVRKTAEFHKWFKKLKDEKAKNQIKYRIKQISWRGYFGDVKSVGDGVYELRIFTGPGYRVYFSFCEQDVILLLLGGDKTSQKRDIELAKSINREYE